MALRFNPPPGWPRPPHGWLPPPDWKPDPSWPHAPPGWQYVINDLQDEEPQPWDLPPVARSEQPRRRVPHLTWVLAGAAAVVAIAALTETLTGGSGNDTTPTSSPSDNTAFTGADRNSPSPSQPTSSTPTPSGSRSYRVLRVVSADTVRLAYQGRKTVRVLGIATPAIVQRGAFAECSNGAASRYASKLLDGATVMLRGIHATGSRVIARIELAGGSRDYGLVMIQHGYAIHDPTTDSGRLRASYRAAEADAKAAHRGLWGHCKSLVPDLAAEDSSAPENPQEAHGQSQPPRDHPQAPPDQPQTPPDQPQAPADPENQDGNGATNAEGTCDSGYLGACE
jgi:endonuclease YncB( thermonuclease family)